MKEHVQDFFHLPPARGHHGPALRVGVGIAVPLLAVVLLGRLDLSVYVIFGSLTGVFGRADAHRLRFQHLVLAGAMMSGGVIAGAAAAISGLGPWAVTAAAIGLAVLLSIVSDRLQLRPAGPFFYLFAFTTTAGLPYLGELWEAALAAVGSAATVVLLGFLAAVLSRNPISHGPRPDFMRPRWPEALARAARYAVAVGLAGGAAIVLGLGHHHWAMLAATAPIAAADFAGAANRALHNIVGTFAGVALSAVLMMVDWTPLGLVLLLASLQFANELYAIRHYSLALVFLTPVALMMTSFVISTPAHQLIYDRVVETIIGASLALLIVVVTGRRAMSARIMRPLSAPAGGPWPRPRAANRP